MENAIAPVQEEQLITEKDIRERFMNRLEVLDRVKKLLLIPQMDCMTIGQIADFYEVEQDTIKKVILNNSDELKSDGMYYATLSEFKEITKGTKIPLCKIAQQRTFLEITLEDGTKIKIPNRGIRMFPKRAILRMGMLLRDSEVAKEIRTQLLNIEENASETAKTAGIDEEQRLALNVAKGFLGNNIEELMKAATEFNAFQNRHIKRLENDNKALAKEILTWEDRSKLNAGIRMLACKTGRYHGILWNELYKELQYKHRINLKKRGAAPFIQWIKEKEWPKVMSEFSAMCVAYGQSPTEMFQKTIPMKNLEPVE